MKTSSHTLHYILLSMIFWKAKTRNYVSPLLSILIQVKKKCVTVKLNKLILKQDVKVQRYTSSEFSKFCFALASGSLVSV